MDVLRNFAFPEETESAGGRWWTRFALLTLGCVAAFLIGFILNRSAPVPPIMPITGEAMAGL